MTEHAWFRLMLRGVGVLLIGLAAPSVFSYLGWLGTMAGALQSSGWIDGGQIWMLVANAVGAAAQLGLGIYLVTGGHGLYRYCIRGLSGLCATCGYDLRGTDSGRCPECGTAVIRRASEPPSEREAPAAVPPPALDEGTSRG